MIRSATQVGPFPSVEPGTQSEREKWDQYYADAPLPEEDDALKRFNLGFSALARELLEPGARTLEAGCGGGWQSLALARLGEYDVTSMDFSRAALDYARRLFEREGCNAEFVLQDVFETGEPAYDLVFNAGVLEHYELDEQVAFLRGMKSRSRKFVLALVPNRLCYWYWLWRMEEESEGRWPYGKEVPRIELSAAFEGAGLTLLGQTFLGESWTEHMINSTQGLSPAFRAAALTVHRSPVIPPPSKCYLVAVLGCVHEPAPSVPPLWRAQAWSEEPRVPQLSAALCDALAAHLGSEQQCRAARETATTKTREADELRRTLELLEQRREELEQLLGDLRTVVDERGRWTATLEAKLQDRDEQAQRAAQAEASLHKLAEVQQRLNAELTAREQAISELRRAQSELTSRLDQAAQDFRDKRDEADQIWRRLQDLEATVAQKDAELLDAAGRTADAELRLREIHTSTGWHLLQMLYRIRFFFFPRGSRRERIAKWLMRLQRRMRGRGSRTPPAIETSRAIEAPRAAPPVELHAAEFPGLVSVILPVYNQADLLRESIESVLGQTYEDFELIVIDDGSTDQIARVLDDYVTHPKLRVLRQQNQKLPKALSNGFDFARGEFWTWTSADNLMEPQQLARQVDFLRAHPEAQMVYCDYLAIDDRGEPLSDPNFRPHNRRSPESAEIHLPRTTETLNDREDNFIGACFMYRGWVGRLLGDYAPHLGVEDYDYWMRVNRLFSVQHLGDDRLLYRYRVHDNTLNARAAEHRILERVQRLMTYEKQRAADYARPWIICADQASRAWLGPLDLGPHTLSERSVQDLDTDALADERVLLILRADGLAALRGVRLPSSWCVAVWLEDSERAVCKYACDVQQFADVAFVPDRAGLSRLGIYMRSVFAVPPGASLLDTTIKFANNAVFFRATTPPDERARRLPRCYFPAARRVKVLLQVENFMQGGLEQVVLDIAAVLDPERFELSLLVLGQEGVAAARARQLGVSLHTLPEQGRDQAYRDYLREQAFDVVNAHCAPYGARIAAELEIPFVQTVHNSYIWFDHAMHQIHQDAEPYTRAFLCVSAEAGHYADLRLGFAPEKIVLVPNGINVEAIDAARSGLDRAAERDKLGFAPDDFVFLNAASLYPPKAQHLLVAALAQAVQRCPQVKVAFLGRPLDQAYAERVRADAERFGVAERIAWLGYQNEPHRFYCLCDGFVLPSFVEGWSLALTEALCARLPIIATGVGSARDLLTRTGGCLLSPPFDSMIDVDMQRLYKLLEQEHAELVAELSEALVTTAQDPRPPELSASLAASLDRRYAYQAYATLFEWFAQGGHPAGARAWARIESEVYGCSAASSSRRTPCSSVIGS